MAKMPLYYDPRMHYLSDADGDFWLDCGDANMCEEDAVQIAEFTKAACKNGVEDKPTITPKDAMKIAKEAYAHSSAEKEAPNTSPAPAPYIMMTAANLVRFFEIASKEFKP